MESKQIIQSSERITQDRRKFRNISNRNWPWNLLDCGQSFAVQKDEIKFKTLRSICSIKGKQFGKRFKAVEHDNCYEVGRIE